MRNYEEKMYKGPVKEGFYVSSSHGSGIDCAIALEYVETPDSCARFSFSPDEARQLAKLLIEVADEFDQGIETGIF